MNPNNLKELAEAERAVLGAMLHSADAIAEVALVLDVQDLREYAHQRIFTTILALWDGGTPVDLVTVANGLKQQGNLDDAGGYGGLGELWEACPSVANAAYHARIVRDHAIRRRLSGEASVIAGQSDDPAIPVETLLDEAQRRILAVGESGIGEDDRSAAEVVGEVYDHIDARAKKAGEGGFAAAGVSTGLPSLDIKLTGLQDGELIVLAARPSVGKTGLAVAIAGHVALNEALPVLFVSLEQGRAELFERLMCSLARVDGQRVRQGVLDEEETARFTAAGERLTRAPLYVSDQPEQRIYRIAARARRAKQRRGLALLVIDYLQLIEPENRRDPRHEQVAQVSRKLKHLARELRIPVLALAQLNREVENRKDPSPKLSDLRESGSIEADADTVLLLHQPAGGEGCLEVNIAKQRNGPTGSVLLSYDRAQQRFSDPACDTPWERAR